MKNKEPEWIVSPEELKRNQERALMKERKEKYDRNQTILIIVGIIVFALILYMISAINKDIIERCIEAGNTLGFCKQAIG